MTVIDNKLLRSKRAQAVPQQNVWLASMFVLRDDPKRNHVLDELIETAGLEFAKTSGRLCRQAMTSVIISVNDKVASDQFFGYLAIAAYVFTKSMGDLNDATNLVMNTPFHTCNGPTVRHRRVDVSCLSRD